jgi:lipoyl-dependent peroxiredoxin
MAKRTASAVWEGNLREGKGKVKLGSGAFEGQYSFSSRFEEGTGTNPEELIGAAHAGCFSMALAAGLTCAGHNPKRISTTANVSLEKVGEGFKITTIELNTEGEVPGIDEQTFLDAAESAKKNCPVSQALAGVDIKLNATFVKSAAA